MSANSLHNSKSIGICGVACRLPGAANVEEFKNLLFDGRCAVSEIPDARWKKWPFYHSEIGKAGRSYTFAAGVIDDIWGFDPNVFNISPREAAAMDPQQRILLQLVWEALEDSGIIPSELAGKHVGVYVGVSSSDYSRRMAIDPFSTSDPYIMTGNALSIVANRISHAFDFRGPSLAIDTACSSSLVALDRAFCDLNSGRIDTAVVGGINILASPDPFGGFSVANMLSKSGICHSFGNKADGYVRAEGGVALVLQSPAASRKPGVGSRANLITSRVNSDGWTPGISLPSKEAQAELLKDAYEHANLDPNDLLFVEAHGTGTFVGDPIEASALGHAIGQRRTDPLYMGSVKSNIGHLEPASGLAGILKAIVSLENNKLPATLHAEEPNSNIDFEELNLKLAQDPIRLKEVGEKSLAGISSFGFGGMNAHAVISKGSNADDQLDKPDSKEAILMLSGACKQSLDGMLAQYSDRLANTDATSAQQTCNNAFHYREKFSFRAAVLNNASVSKSDAINAYLRGEKAEQILYSETELENQSPVFVYSGNGSQYPGMCLAALKSDEAYANHFLEIDSEFEKLSGWNMKKILEDPDLPEKIGLAEVAQPLLFADQVALTRALSEKGMKPSAVIGHSGGEISAACCSGSLPLDQALRTIIERSKCQEVLRGTGTMLAVQASSEAISEALDEFGDAAITIAAINSPRSVTIVGPPERLSEFQIWIRRSKRWAGVKLDVDYPYHSPMQDQIEQQFRDGLKGLTPQVGEIPFYSSVMGKKVTGSELDEDYWWSLIRSPVRFNESIESLCKDGFRFFIECGAQAVLLSYIKDCVEPFDGEYALLPSFGKKDSSSVNPVMKTLYRGIINGAKVDAQKVFGDPQSFDRSLPSYPWQNRDFRKDESAAIDSYFGLSEGASALLGRQVGSAANCWISSIDANLMPDLADHVVGGSAILPGTGFLEAALCAARQVLNEGEIEIRNMDIFAPLGITDNNICQMRTVVSEETQSLTISSKSLGVDMPWQDHARCRIATANSEINRNFADAPIFENDRQSEDGNILYEYGKLVGLEYGEAFKRVKRFRQVGPTIVEVLLHEPSSFVCDKNYECLVPPAADAILHGLLALLFRSDEFPEGLGFVPVFLKRLRLLQSGVPIHSGRVEVTRVGRRSILAECTYFDEHGKPIAILEGIRLRAVKLIESLNMDEHVFRTELKTIASFGTAAKAQSPKLDKISEVINEIAVSETFAPEDDSYFIVEAISKAIAHEAAIKFCDANHVFHSPDLGPDTESRQVVEAALEILLLSNLADEVDGEVSIVPDTGLPSSNEMIAGLLSDNPERVAECRILLCIGEQLSALMSGEIAPDSETVFGRNNFRGFLEYSTVAQRKRQLVNEILSNVFAHYDEAASPSVMVVSNDVELRAYLSNNQHKDAHEFSVFSAEELDLNTKSNSQSINLESELGSQGEYDLVVAIQDFGPNELSKDLVAGIRNHVSAGGILIALQTGRTSFYDLLNCAGGFGTGSRADWPEISFTNETWKKETGLHGFKDSKLFALPDNFYNQTCLLAKKSGEAPEATKSKTKRKPDVTIIEFAKFLAGNIEKSQGKEQTTKPVWNDLCQGYEFLAAASKQESDDCPQSKWFVWPEIANAVDARDVLERRILYLSEFLRNLDVTTSEICLVLPDAANSDRAESVSPSQSAIWNMARTIRNEYPHLLIRTIDPGTSFNSTEIAENIFTIVNSGTDEVEIVLDADHAFAVRIKTGLIGADRELANSQDSDGLNATLTVPMNGRISELKWTLSERRPLAPNEVEIQVDATGLNYRDVMWAMGLLPEEALEKGFVGSSVGMECAGKVVRIGDKVESFAVGDRVMAVGSACFATYVTLDASYCFKLPAETNTKSAAVMPVTFFTAFYSLVHAARVQKGEKVLIHGGAGGVGLAAIQLAQLKGAEVFATAGSPDKRALLQTLGVTHILDSRSLNFEDEIMAATNNEGVDVILNSLAGPAMERSLGILKPFGRFIELGKQDFYANTKVGLRPFRENIEYISVDVDQLLSVKPELTKKVFGQITQLYEKEQISPIPFYHLGPDEVVDAFKFMQRSAHVGKVTVRPPNPTDANLDIEHARYEASSHGAHIIAGGAGGFGFATAKWLIHHGAKQIFLLGRGSTLPEQVQTELDTIEFSDASINYVQCDISNKTNVEKVLEEIRSVHPIVGIINAAMHLEDAAINDLDQAGITATLASKCAGSDNLSEATSTDELDYFVLFSSIAAMVGNQRQATYVAANAYIEAIIRKRNKAGLPGLAIGWGAISDVGYLNKNKAASEVLKKVAGGIQFTSHQALDWLGKVLANPSVARSNPVVGVTNMQWRNLSNSLTTLKTPTFELLTNSENEPVGISDNSDLRVQLAQLPPEKAEIELAKFIQEEISKILRIDVKDVSLDKPMTDLGMDSLMGVEFGMAAQQSLGDDIPLISISDGASVRQVAKRIIRHIDISKSMPNPAHDLLENLVLQHSDGQNPQDVSKELGRKS